MLTGDNPLTACHVAKELKITTRKVLVLTPTQDGWVWQSVGGNRTVSMDTRPAELGSTYDLCLAGEVSYCQVNNEKYSRICVQLIEGVIFLKLLLLSALYVLYICLHDFINSLITGANSFAQGREQASVPINPPLHQGVC